MQYPLLSVAVTLAVSFSQTAEVCAWLSSHAQNAANLYRRPFPVSKLGVGDRQGSTTGRCVRVLASSTDSTEASFPRRKGIVDRSTLTLLEHINLNAPSHEHIVPFYFGLLGCGLDPRKAANLSPNAPKQTLWANCGASQFHLPYGDPAQTLPGQIGLRFESLEGLKNRLDDFRSSYVTAEHGKDKALGQDYIRIVDHYGNVFMCRAKSGSGDPTRWRQPIIPLNAKEEWGEIATNYGRLETECKGIDYVEFDCPKGTASKIALFYESVLDATTSTHRLGDGSSIAIVAVGNVDETGRSDQSILFRETDKTIPEYDGHHIALYVGEAQADFEQAFKNALVADVVWCNPRFQDQVDSLEEARKERQFRFKDILDMDTGERIMELEHELRSVEHPAWPGRSIDCE